MTGGPPGRRRHDPTRCQGDLPWGRTSHSRARRCGLLRRSRDITLRQIHDPIGCGALSGSTLTFQIRWRRLPAAYREFIRDRLTPDAGCLLIRDVRPWPVLRLAPGHTFQIGSPIHGWRFTEYALDHPPFRRLLGSLGERQWKPARDWPSGYAETAVEPEFEPDLHRAADDAGRPLHTIVYLRPEALSAGVADLYRTWWRSSGADRGGDCVVETGRLLDPWQVLAAGMVPYWCETASRRAAGAAESWMAASPPFESVIVLPQPPGTACEAHADASQWRSIARFARVRPEVDRRAVGRYPTLPLPTSHAAAALRARRPARVGPAMPGPMPMAQAINSLRSAAQLAGLLVM